MYRLPIQGGLFGEIRIMETKLKCFAEPENPARLQHEPNPPLEITNTRGSLLFPATLKPVNTAKPI